MSSPRADRGNNVMIDLDIVCEREAQVVQLAD